MAAVLALLATGPLPAWGQEDPFAPQGGDGGALGADPFGADAGADPFGADAGADPFGAAPAGDPFGAAPAGDAAFGAAPAAGDAGDGLEAAEAEDPLLAELRRYAEGSNERLALAIREASRIGAWSAVNDFLKIMADRNLSQAQRAQAAAVIGGPRLVRIKMTPAVNAPSREMVDRLRDASRQRLEDPQRIRAAIERLDQGNVDARLQAFRILLAGGRVSAAEVARAAVAPEPPVDRPLLVRVLKELGTDADRAVEAFLLYGQSRLRPGALRTLIALRGDDALPSAVAMLHAESSTDEVRSIAAAMLDEQLSRMPTRAEAETYLLQRLQRLERAAARIPADEVNAPLWTIDEEGQSVASERVPRRLAALARVHDAATRLLGLPSLEPAARAAALTAELDYQVQSDPQFGLGDEAAGLRDDLGIDSVSQAVLADALQRALQGRRDAASVGLLRLLPADPRWVISQAGQPTLLVDAASHPNPRVRYEAVLAILRMEADAPYAGSSFVLSRLGEMARLAERPTALLIEPRLVQAAMIERQLVALGFEVERFAAVQSAVERIEEGGDFQLIAATTRPFDYTPIEAVDRIRRRSLGRDIPILFFGEPRPELTERRFAAPVRVITKPIKTIDEERYEVLLETLRQLADQLRPDNLEPFRLRLTLFPPDLRTGLDRREPPFEARARYAAAAEMAAAELRESRAERSFDFFGGALGIGDRPIGLVVRPSGVAEDDPREEVQRELRLLLESLSFSYENVPSLASIPRRLASSRPVEMIFVPADLVAGSADEVTSQIHAMDPELPIFFFSGDSPVLEEARFRPVARRRFPDSTPATLTTTLQQIRETSALSPLTVDQRQFYRSLALDALAEIAADPDRSFYDVRGEGVEALFTAPMTGSSDAGIAVLSRLGTPTSQATLARFAGNPLLSAAARRRAAAGFARSVERFGTRLRRRDVVMQYKRFNASSDPEVQATIGAVIDAMERRVGIEPPTLEADAAAANSDPAVSNGA